MSHVGLFKVSWGGDMHSPVIYEGLTDETGKILDWRDAKCIHRAFVKTSKKFRNRSIISIIGGYFVISNRAMQIFRQVRIAPDITAVPVDVFVHGRLYETDYWWLDTEHRFSVLDRAKSGLPLIDDPTVISFVRKWVVSADLLPPFDFFRGDKGTWFATESLKRLIESESLSNFRLEEVEVV